MNENNVMNNFPEIEVNTYEFLRDWLIADLDDVQIMPDSVFSVFAKYLNKLKVSANKRSLKENLLLDSLQEIASKVKKNELSKKTLNERLQEIFLNAFFTKESYVMRKNEFTGLSFEFLIKERLKYPNPLPSLDGLVALKNEGQKLNQLQRAAILIKGLVQLALEINDGNYNFSLTNSKKANPVAFKYMFGATVSSREYPSVLVKNKTSNYIAILICGQVYKMRILNDKREGFAVDFIYAQLGKIISDFKKNGANRHYPIGALSVGSRLKCYKVRKKLTEKNIINEKSLDILDKALFTVSLDNDANFSSSTKASLETVYIGNFQNRWYGATQLIVDASGEAFLILCYPKGASSNVLEFGDEVYKRSLNILIKEKTSASIDTENTYKKLDFMLDKNDIKPLETEVKTFVNSIKSVHEIKAGKKFFKNCSCSPNISLHFLLILAIFEHSNYSMLPAANQAVEMAFYRNEAIQTDWVYTQISPILKFLDVYRQHDSTNEQKYCLFREIISSHKLRLYFARKGLSPTYLVYKPEGEFYTQLCNFFAMIGTFAPAYRNYLFRMYRNSDSVDLMSSSLTLPDSLSFVSRPGMLLNIFKNFGVHIMLHENTSTLCFMANSCWVKKLENVIDKINLWINRIALMTAQKQEDGVN